MYPYYPYYPTIYPVYPFVTHAWHARAYFYSPFVQSWMYIP